MKRTLQWLFLSILLAVIIAIVFTRHGLSLDLVKSYFQPIQSWQKDHFLLSAVAFLLCFAVADGAGLPITALMAVMAGALFPLWLALPLAVLARSMGDIGAFWLARHWLRDWVERRYPVLAAGMEKSLAQNGLYYLFLLRLIPGLPPPLVNIGMALTHIPLMAFASVNALGLLIWTGIYVYAGQRLSILNSLRDVMEPRILLAVSVLGLFTFLLSYFQKRRNVTY